MLYNLILSPETNCSHIRWLKMLKTKMFFSTASEAKREVKSLISIETSMNSENMGHLWHKMSRIYLKKLEGPCQISSYFWVFWGKIQLSNGHKVSWFWVGWKILLDLIFPHVGLSSMPFWSKYTDPPTFMICGFKKEHMLIVFCCQYWIWILQNINTYLKGSKPFWPITSISKHSGIFP